MSTFSGFSEEELKRIKSGETGANSVSQINSANVKKLDKIVFKPKRVTNQYKLPILQNQSSDDSIDNIEFDKCKLSIRSETTAIRSIAEEKINTNNKENVDKKENVNKEVNKEPSVETEIVKHREMETENTYKSFKEIDTPVLDRKNSMNEAPDIVRGMDNYSEDELENHKAKLQDLQLRQKLMEEQNKRRKEMLAKALADRTKQTSEEVMKLEKIKKELQVLDSQFSHDVSLLRQKIDQACLSYADAEKHYLRVEKEFLQAKIHLQKEKEKKELLTEHLCALITHNETRKAQKLETLMLELATDKKQEKIEENIEKENDMKPVEDDKPEIVDGVDERTGKMVEMTPQS